jgi:hypothetical protein
MIGGRTFASSNISIASNAVQFTFFNDAWLLDTGVSAASAPLSNATLPWPFNRMMWSNPISSPALPPLAHHSAISQTYWVVCHSIEHQLTCLQNRRFLFVNLFALLIAPSLF